MKKKIDHPAWPKSKLPPQTLAALNRFSSEERRVYLSTLISKRALKQTELESIAKRMGESWVTNQSKWLQSVIDELQAMIDLETRGHVNYDGIEYTGTTQLRLIT